MAPESSPRLRREVVRVEEPSEAIVRYRALVPKGSGFSELLIPLFASDVEYVDEALAVSSFLVEELRGGKTIVEREYVATGIGRDLFLLVNRGGIAIFRALGGLLAEGMLIENEPLTLAQLLANKVYESDYVLPYIVKAPRTSSYVIDVVGRKRMARIIRDSAYAVIEDGKIVECGLCRDYRDSTMIMIPREILRYSVSVIPLI